MSTSVSGRPSREEPASSEVPRAITIAGPKPSKETGQSNPKTKSKPSDDSKAANPTAATATAIIRRPIVSRGSRMRASGLLGQVDLGRDQRRPPNEQIREAVEPHGQG